MNDFESVAKQRHITIHKSPLKTGAFMTLDLEANTKAMKELSFSAYMLYIYFCINADKYEFWLSKALTCEKTDMSKNTYYSAFNELKSKGYLVPNKSKTFFDFYDTPNNLNRPKNKNAPPQNWDKVSQKEAEKIYKQINTENIANATFPVFEEAHTLSPDAQSHVTLIQKQNSIFWNV